MGAHSLSTAAVLRPDPGSAALRSIVRNLTQTRDGATYFAGRVWGAVLRSENDGAVHPLVGRSAPDVALVNGRRLNDVLRDGRAWLIDLDPAEPLRTVAAGWADQLGYLAGTPTPDVDSAALLVRPDGVVSWAGREADRAAPILALARWLGEPARQRPEKYQAAASAE
ncbi:hypothetical protein GCM10009102_09470 [Sphingomonas insulae]|uniref:Uncharacterized protein n=1 Tax=Sphingomonas insulae TaxID=424800 RepID=A0ABN1HQ56_9SPHN